MPAIDTLVAQASWLALEQPDIQTLQTLHNEVKTSAEQKNLPVLDVKHKALEAHLTALVAKKAELATTITQYRAEIATMLEPFKQELANLKTEVQATQPTTPPVEEAPKKEPWFFAKLMGAENPAEFINDRKKGIGKMVVGTLAAFGSIFGLKSLFSKKGEADKTKSAMQTQFEWFANNVATWFGINEPFPTTPNAPATPQAPEKTETTDRTKLLARLQSAAPDFKEAKVGKRAELLTDNALLLLVQVAEKFPGVRITSTIRTDAENSALPNSAEDSCHCYGEGFDIGQDLRNPPTYTLEWVKQYMDDLSTKKNTLIHGEWDAKHLHIDTDEGKVADNKRTKEKLDAKWTAYA